MNEITRIHIAKVPYDIEISAKKEIEKYIRSLEKYANDNDLLMDIEIRITELLSERRILANGVIAYDDVKAIRDQLGEPKDFRSDDDIENEKEDELTYSAVAPRKLYRNIDQSVLGGVLSGFASFLKISPIWTRLLFMILFFVSAGSIALMYILLWVIIPPARTATERLQMNGRPVNIASIRELNSVPENNFSNEKVTNFRNILLFFSGIFCLCASVTTLIFTVFAAFSIVRLDVFGMSNPEMGWIGIIAYVLAVMAGVLLALLFGICAYMSFAHKATKKILTILIFVIAVGLASFGVFVGIMMYRSSYIYGGSNSSLRESDINLPENFSKLKELTINSDALSVDYIVSSEHKIKFNSNNNAEKPIISMNGDKASVSSSNIKNIFNKMVLTVYGPKLNSVTVDKGILNYYNDSFQDLSINTTSKDSAVNLQSGVYEKLIIESKNSSSVNAEMVTVEKVGVDISTNSNISLGIIKSLSVIQPTACPSESTTAVNIKGINSKWMTYNGAVVNAETIKTVCGSVYIGDSK